MTAGGGGRGDPSRGPLRILVAPDSFKGTLPATEVAARLATGLRRERPELRAEVLPVADGGEGTVDAALASGFQPVQCEVTGPLGERRGARYARRQHTAVIEMATASGLALLQPTPETALAATSRGVGDLIRHALDHDAERIVLGVGGSASTDGGAGMVRALGARLVGPDGELPDGGGALAQLRTVDLRALDRRLRDTTVLMASDVDNPLLGEAGAAAVYAPQKGADPAAVLTLEEGLMRWVHMLHDAGVPASWPTAQQPGAGAAGGVGYAALALLGADRKPGIDVVMELTAFGVRLEDADLVITGEGSLDEQSLHGKAPVGVARAAVRRGVPTIAVCGRTTLTGAQLRQAGFRSAYALTTFEPDLQRCMAEPGPILERIGAQVAHDLTMLVTSAQ